MECGVTQIYNISNHMWYIFAFIFHHIKKPEEIDASISNIVSIVYKSIERKSNKETVDGAI